MKKMALVFVLAGMIFLINSSQAEAFSYVVKKEDTLSEICFGVFATGKRAVWEREAKRLGIKNPHLIIPGAVLYFDKVYASQKKNIQKAILLLNAYTEKNADERSFIYAEGCFRCIYEINGRRYIAHYDKGIGNNDGWLSFWVMPNDMYSEGVTEIFSDHGLDGNVKVAKGGGCGELKNFNIISYSSKVGLEYRDYWQFMYNRAIADILLRFA